MAKQPSICGSIPGAKFLGVSVVDFNASAGWGGQSSEVTINLAADCNEAFIEPTVGQAAVFSMGSFSFCGLVQSWNSKQGSDGALYNVKLISPHPILDNTQVILDHYEGPVPFYNIINVYGFLESLGGNCSQKDFNGTIFGAPAGGFGSSNRTSRGIPWYLIQQSLEALTGGIGGNGTYCKGLAFKNDSYILDLSSIPQANNNYRLTGPTMSVSDIVNQVCEDAGCDYYLQMFPGFGKYVIKVVTIARKNQPAINGIQSFISGQNVISKALGKELRAEVNSTMLIGGKVKQYYQCTNQQGMTPFWGWDAEGVPLKAKQGSGPLSWEVELDFRKINLALNDPVPGNKNWVGENELRAAAGNYESFQKLIQNPGNKNSVLYKYFSDTLGLKLTDVVGADPNAQDNAADIKTSTNDDDPTGDPASKALRDAKSLHHWLNSYVSDVYGKQFLVYFSLDSVICRSVDSDTDQVTYSDIVSTDGAWPSVNYASDATTILGLTNPSIASDMFKDDSGKVQPMVKFSSGDDINTKGLNNDSFIVDPDNNDIWIKATVDEKWVIGSPKDPEGTKDSIRGALITLSNGIVDVEADEDSIETNRPIDVFQSTGKLTTNASVEQQDGVSNSKKKLDGQGATVNALGPAYKLDPAGIGVPLQSTTTCYGPWKQAGADPGSTNVEVDEGLVPWEYGGFDSMNAAGTAKIAESSTWQQEAARGEVSVPGLPTRTLASNINDGGAVSSTYDTRKRSIGGFNYSFYGWGSTLTGGAVISNISVSVGTNGVTTTYTVNSFTPVFGRFTKGNAERLKQIGLNRQKGEREMRARSALRNLIRASERRTDVAGSVASDIGKGNVAPKSPAVAFVGKMLSDSSADFQRKLVISPTKTTMPFYAKSEADKTSMMTMDGFFRPVQSSSSDKGNLPKVVSSFGSCGSVGGADSNLSNSTGPPPPVMDAEGNAVKPLDITAKYLNFLTNPKDIDNTWIGEDDGRAASSTKGHDIEGVARGNAGEEWSSNNPGKLLMQSGGMSEGGSLQSDYNEDYRFLALRGPLMIHGWGYDLNGKPIPNKAGDSIGSFQTSYSNLKDEFKDDWLANSRTWPVAPVDLRFDRKRGVWTSPNAFRLYQIEVSGNIGPGADGKGIVIKTKNDITSGGSPVESPTIDVENWTNTQIESGAKAMAYYDTAECKYWIIPPPSGTSGVLKVGTTGCCEDACNPCTGLTGCFMIGSGLEGNWPSGLGIGDFVVTGPKIQSGDCQGTPQNEPESFDKLIFVSGMRLAKTDPSGCTWKISGPTIQESGCDNNGSRQGLSNLVIGSGLGFYQLSQPEDPNDPERYCHVELTGPKIQSGKCDGSTQGIAESFSKLIFVSGLTSQKISEDGCEWKIAGPKIQKSGCGTTAEAKPYEKLIIGSGITMESDIDGNACHIKITGPKIQSGKCNGAAEGIAEAFDTIRFISGMRTVKRDECEWEIAGPTIQESGCENGSVEGLSKLLIGSGLHYEKVKDCEVVIHGPKIKVTDCENPTNIDHHFTQITFVSGMRVKQEGSAGADACKFNVAGPTIQHSPCGSSPATPVAFKNLVVGTGLHYAYDATKCEIALTGPKIKAAMCGNPAIDSQFQSVTFTSGLRVIKTDSHEANCNFNIGGPTLQNNTCDTNENPVAFSNLVIGTGLTFASADGDCHYRISGPKVSHTPCGGGSSFADQAFDKLIFSTGLFPQKDGNCNVKVAGPKGKHNNSCVTASYGTESHFSTLEFGKGITPTWTSSSCTWKIEGPGVKLVDCGDSDGPYSFQELWFGSGLWVDNFNNCIFKITGPHIYQDAPDNTCLSEDTAKKNVPEFSFTKLNVGEGILLERNDCNATISASMYIEMKDSCDHPDIAPSRFEKLNISTGLKLTKEDEYDLCYKITGPQIGTEGQQCDETAKIEPKEFYKLIISDGLLLEEKDAGKCEFTLKGPTVSSPASNGDKWKAGEKCGSDEAPVHFCNLEIGDGLELRDGTEGAIKDDASKYIASCGIQIGKVGCGEVVGENVVKDVKKWSNELWIGKGLDFKNDDGPITISGPKILAEDCSTTQEAKPFAKLSFGTGLILTETEAGDCEFKVVGPQLIDHDGTTSSFQSLTINKGLKIEGVGTCTPTLEWSGLPLGSVGCTAPADGCEGQERVVQCLLVGDGLELASTEGVTNTIKGPKIENKYFKNLTLRGGLELLPLNEGVDDCRWILSGTPGSGGSGIKIASVGCNDDGATVGCEDFGGCLVFGTGLHGAFTDPETFTINGPTVATKAGTCGDSVTTTYFEGLTFGSGLQVTEKKDGEASTCVWEIDACGTKIGETGCAEDSATNTECAPTDCIMIGPGLNLEDGSLVKGTNFDGTFAKKFTLKNLEITSLGVQENKDCHYMLSGSAPTKIKTGNDNCEGGMSVTPCKELACLTVGSGLRIAAGGGADGNGNYTIEACGSGGGCSEGHTEDIALVTDVCCSGAQFIAIKRTFVFEDGCLKSVGTPSNNCDNGDD